MFAVFAVGSGRREPKDPMGVCGLVGQSIVGEPIQYAVERYPINSGQVLATKGLLDLAVANRRMACSQQAENPDTGRRYARSQGANGRFNFQVRRTGIAFHTKI
jgi:hypothetical protein